MSEEHPVDDDDLDDAEDDTLTGDEDFTVAVEVAKVLALGDKYQAEAEYAKWQAKREELAYREELLAHEWQLDGVYSFHEEVTQESADRLLQSMSIWHQHNSERPWTIQLNSVGGSIYAGNSIIDELIAHSLRGGGTHEITIKTRGVAASMGGMILQAGDHRVMGRNSMLMIHRGGADGVHGTADVISDMAEWFRRDTDWMIGYFLDRTDAITRPEFLAKIDRRDWWLNSTEALDFGLVDRIG